jgi:cation diffusion facilitator family transporter
MKFDHCRSCRSEVVWWAFIVNIFQTIFKGLLGLMTGSAALVADSLHSGADVVASGVTMASLKLSNRPPDERHPYGYGNIQFISGAIVGMILIMGAIYLIYESSVAVISGNYSSPSVFALFGAAVSALTNELMYRYQHCVGSENNSPAILANAWDNRSDALSSIGVLIGIAIAVMGFPMADDLAAIVVGLMVMRIGIELNSDAIAGLMDSSVDMDTLKGIYAQVVELHGVEGITYLRGRNVGEALHIELNIKVNRNATVRDSDQITAAVYTALHREFDHVSDVKVLFTPVEVIGQKFRPDAVPAS